jgi:hypothetical protein
VGFVLDCLHDVATNHSHLYPVHAHLFHLANARSCLIGILWVGDSSATGPSEHRVDKNPGCSNLPASTPGPQRQSLLQLAADVANTGNATRQPDLELVFKRLRYAIALVVNVGVSVDQSGKNVLTSGVNFDGCGQTFRTAIECHRIERNHFRDAVVFDNYVVGSRSGRAIAINDHRVADGQTRVSPAVHRTGLRYRDGRECKPEQ